MAILVPWMALLKGSPVIAEDLFEGVFVDPLPCGCHSAGLYHVLAPRSSWFCTLLSPSLPIVFPCRDGQKAGASKRKFLYAPVIHWCQELMGFVAFAVLLPQASEARSCS